MRALLPALLLLTASCAPHSVIPAVGSTLTWEFCGSTAQGVQIVRGEDARCPDLLRVDEHAKRVKAAYRGCSLDGVKVHVTSAYVQCGDEWVHGCTVGSNITVQDEVRLMPLLAHEFAHVCISQLHGVDSLRHFNLDRTNALRNDNDTDD